MMSERRAVFLVVLTLRSDFLDRLQAAPGRSFDIVPFTLDPLPKDRIPDIIRKPARVVGLTIDEGVVQAAIRDAGSVYALPLLAFALREIYEADKAKDDKGHWTLEDYEVLGDPAAKLNPIENAVRKAAERVMAQAELRGADRGLVRRVFVPRLVRVNDEGRYVRQSARVAEFDTAERALVDDLIGARLLAIWEENGEDRIEVAHEALFTKWPTLNAILEEDSRVPDRPRAAQARSQGLAGRARGSEGVDAAVGCEASRARSWLGARPKQLSPDERDFIEASVAAAAAQERRLLARRVGRSQPRCSWPRPP